MSPSAETPNSNETCRPSTRPIPTPIALAAHWGLFHPLQTETLCSLQTLRPLQTFSLVADVFHSSWVLYSLWIFFIGLDFISFFPAHPSRTRTFYRSQLWSLSFIIADGIRGRPSHPSWTMDFSTGRGHFHLLSRTGNSQRRTENSVTILWCYGGALEGGRGVGCVCAWMSMFVMMVCVVFCVLAAGVSVSG
ncbi:hypothetical protein VTJ04DRAFT_750 [Mycothermus thermophilus]|uniref:uncharacterized protein n=1 Tax=Humicola insolens TaxID=85995 RepID=UPI003742E3C5